MVIVNPVAEAANWFLAFLSVIPTPILFLLYAFIGFFVISALVNIIRN